MRTWSWMAVVMVVVVTASCRAGEQQIVLRDYVNQQWTAEGCVHPHLRLVY